MTLCIKRDFAPFIQSFLPNIEIFIFDNSAGEAKARESLYNFVREEEVAAVLDLHDTLRTKLIRWTLIKGIPSFVARKPRLREFLIYFLRLGFLFGLGRGGRAKRFLAAAKRTHQYLKNIETRETSKTDESSRLTSLEKPAIESLRSKYSLPVKYIVVAPGGAWVGKRWSAEKFAFVAKTLAARLPILVLGSVSDEWCADIASAAHSVHPDSRSLAGDLNMSESGIIAAHAVLVIGNDTGLVHVAEACATPTVMIEGPTHPSLGYSTYAPESKIVGVDLLCRPCSKNGRICWRFGSRACMSTLDVDTVLVAARDLLERPVGDSL